MEQYFYYILFLPLAFLLVDHLIPRKKNPIISFLIILLPTLSTSIFLFLLMRLANNEGSQSLVIHNFLPNFQTGMKLELLFDTVSTTFSFLASLLLLLSIILNYLIKKESFLIKNYAAGLILGLLGNFLFICSGNLFTFILGFEVLVLSIYIIDSVSVKEGESESLQTFIFFQAVISLFWVGGILLEKTNARNFLALTSIDPAQLGPGHFAVLGGELLLLLGIFFLPRRRRLEKVFFPIQQFYFTYLLPLCVMIVLIRFHNLLLAWNNIFSLVVGFFAGFLAIKAFFNKDSRELLQTSSQSLLCLSLLGTSLGKIGEGLFLFLVYVLGIMAVGQLIKVYIGSLEKTFRIKSLSNLQEKSPLLFWCLAFLILSLLGFPGTSGSFAIIGAMSGIMDVNIWAGLWALFCLLILSMSLLRFFFMIGLRKNEELDLNKSYEINPQLLFTLAFLVLGSSLIGYWGLPNFGDGGYSLFFQKYFLESIPAEFNRLEGSSFQGVFFAILPLLFIGITFVCYKLYIKNMGENFFENLRYKLPGANTFFSNDDYFFNFFQKHIIKNIVIFLRLISIHTRKYLFRGAENLLQEGVNEISQSLAQMYGRSIVSGAFIILVVVTLGLCLLLQAIM